MPSVFVYSAGEKAAMHFARTIENGIPLSTFRKHLPSGFYSHLESAYADGLCWLWGDRGGKAGRQYWGQINNGDLALCYRKKRIVAASSVIATIESEHAGIAAWPDAKANPYRLLFFLSKPVWTDVPVASMPDYFGKVYQGLRRLPTSQKIIQDFGTHESFIQTRLLNQRDGNDGGFNRSRIEQARQFLIDEVFDPPLSSKQISKKAKGILQNSKILVKEFKKIGDLARYLNRFWEKGEQAASTYIVEQLEAAGFRTFESIEEEFKTRFQAYLDDYTSLDDFVIGREYTSWDLVIFAKIYDNRSGGILLIGEDSNLQAIFVKASFDGGPCENEWLVPGEVLKYYFIGRKDSTTGDKVFKETYKVNAAIINSKQTPIYVFEKQGTSLTLGGIFKYQSHHEEADGSKWFRLERVKLFDQPRRFVKEEHENELQKRIASRQKDSRAERQARLKKASKKPRSRISESVVYDRNEDVILEVLERAAGICEWCKEPAPFTRRNNQEPYLEVHHLHPLSEGGDDSDENARALCPNCHRKAHYGDVPNPFLKSSS